MELCLALPFLQCCVVSWSATVEVTTLETSGMLSPAAQLCMSCLSAVCCLIRRSELITPCGKLVLCCRQSTSFFLTNCPCHFHRRPVCGLDYIGDAVCARATKTNRRFFRTSYATVSCSHRLDPHMHVSAPHGQLTCCVAVVCVRTRT